MSDETTTHGVERRTIVKAGAWAAPVVLLAAATPAASASVDGTLGWNSSTFGNSGSGFYKPGVQLKLDGGSTDVTGVVVQMAFAPAGLTATVFGLVYGSGWTVDSYAGGDTVNLLWGGSVSPGSTLPPFALDMHFDTTPTSFTATVSSTQAKSPDPLFVAAE